MGGAQQRDAAQLRHRPRRQPGTRGGGSGGAIYADGNLFTILVSGSIVEDNTAHEGGSSIFMVSNDHTGTMRLENSVSRHNTGDSFQTHGFQTIFFLGAHPPTLVGTKLS